MCYVCALAGKYDAAILSRLVDRFEGSVAQLEDVQRAAEAFSLDSFPVVKRLMVRLLYTGADVTERTQLLRGFVREGGGADLEKAFLHRCADSYLRQKQPIHVYMITRMCSLERAKEPVTDLCRLACLAYYAQNRSSRTPELDAVLAPMAQRFLTQGKIHPALLEYQDLVPGLSLYADQSYVAWYGSFARPALIHYRVLAEGQTDGDYQTKPMDCICPGVYAEGFLIFSGEALQYYITEDGGEGNILETGFLEASARPYAGEGSRYGLLDGVMALSLSKADGSSAEQLEKYLYTDFCVGRLFTP